MESSQIILIGFCLGMVSITIFFSRKIWLKKHTEMLNLISKSQRLEKQITHQNYLLDQSNKMKENDLRRITRVKSLLAHDLRTPLSSVHNLNHLIKSTGDLNEKQKKYLDTSTKIILEGLDLISETLEGLKFEKSLDLELETLNINALLKHSLSKVEPSAIVKNQIINTDFHSNVTFLTNRETFQTVIDFLLSNTIANSDPEATIKVKMRLEDESLRVCISARETGSKLDETEISQPLMGNNNDDEEGLMLVQEFVEKLGGTINVDRSKSKGSHFTLVFQRKDHK